MDLGGSELILKDPAGSRILEPLEGSGRLLQVLENLGLGAFWSVIDCL